MRHISKRNSSARYAILRWLIPFWLTGILFIPNIGGEYSISALLISFIWILPPAFLVLRMRLVHGAVYSQRPLARYGTLGFLAVAGASCLYSINPWVSFQYWVVTIVGFMLCAGLWHAITGHEIEVLERFAILGTCGFIYIFSTTYSGTGRFGSIRNPNGIGLMLVGIIAASFAIRWVAIRFACLTACVYMLWHTQSRSAIIATIIAITSYTFLMWKALPRFTKVAFLMGTVAVGTVSFLYRDVLEEPVAAFTTASLQLNDRYRGTNTGFTGRYQLWEIGIDAWQQNWLGGIGYRAHEYYPGLELTVQNGYLAVLVETGALGMLFVLLILFSRSEERLVG